MKKYFLYEFKKSAFTIGCITLIATVIYLTPILIMSPRNNFYGFDTYLWLISLIGGFTAAVLPLWLFSYKTSKRSLDLYFSLPLSHTKILCVKFLIGLIALFFSYTVAYWLGSFLMMAKFFNRIAAVWYLPQYFATLIPLYCIYAISSFVFTRANKFIDGVVFILFWAFAVALAASVFDRLTYSVYMDYYFPFSPLDTATAHFQEHLSKAQDIHADALPTKNLVNLIIGFTITLALAAGATAGLFILEKRVKAENAGQISDSWFGYKTMIPLFGFCLSFFSCSVMWLSYIFIVLITVGAFAVTALYRRTLRIGVKYAAVCFAPIAAGIALFFIELGFAFIFHGI